ncbi:MAG TPA: hypothetical protein VHZ96_22970 [Frankiaceae bacterium]|jgi:hypothetical protein|nr:hypothetical protein [Frankiaceae bacterium]
MRIDLTEVRNVLATVDRMLSEHHGKDVHNANVRPSVRPGTIRLNGRAADQLADDLLVVQDYLRLADAEITALYWMSKGREDPRRPGGPRRPPHIAPIQSSMNNTARDTNSRCGTSPNLRPVTLAR